MDLIDAILLAVILIGISAMVFYDLRFTFRKRASKDWPATEATIDNGNVGFRGALSGVPRFLYRVHFTYSYHVNGCQFTGRFYLLADGKNSGEALQRGLVGKRVPVRYDDRHPAISLLFEQRVMGKRVMQGPPWTYR